MGLKIRYREVISRSPVYGRYGEYQVINRQKIIGRFDFLSQAREAYPAAESMVPAKTVLRNLVKREKKRELDAS